MFTLNNGTFIYSHDSAIEAIRDLGLSIEDARELAIMILGEELTELQEKSKRRGTRR